VSGIKNVLLGSRVDPPSVQDVCEMLSDRNLELLGLSDLSLADALDQLCYNAGFLDLQGVPALGLPSGTASAHANPAVNEDLGTAKASTSGHRGSHDIDSSISGNSHLTGMDGSMNLDHVVAGNVLPLVHSLVGVPGSVNGAVGMNKLASSVNGAESAVGNQDVRKVRLDATTPKPIVNGVTGNAGSGKASVHA
jgi:hypothetical protein